jgi:hypothetical protein
MVEQLVLNFMLRCTLSHSLVSSSWYKPAVDSVLLCTIWVLAGEASEPELSSWSSQVQWPTGCSKAGEAQAAAFISLSSEEGHKLRCAVPCLLLIQATARTEACMSRF